MSLIAAELDFLNKWDNIIDQLFSLSQIDYNINIGVLKQHIRSSSSGGSRAHVRSDELYSEIKLVLSKFMEPFIQLFRQTTMLLLKTPSPNSSLTTPASNYVLIAQAMVLLVDIYHDLTCQDLPPAVEDTHEEFFGPDTGWFQAFLLWDPEDLRVYPDEITALQTSQNRRAFH